MDIYFYLDGEIIAVFYCVDFDPGLKVGDDFTLIKEVKNAELWLNITPISQSFQVVEIDKQFIKTYPDPAEDGIEQAINFIIHLK